MSISRRHFLLTASGALAVGGLAPAVVRAQASVKLGTAVLGDYALAGPFIVASDKGFFQAEGLNVEFVPFRGGPNLVKAVIAGEVLLGATGSTDILVFREAGMPIKMVATHTEGNHFTLNVAPDVASVADLKGKSIGVTSAGSTTWVFARMVAKNQGWDPDRDVKVVALGGLDAQLAALSRKEIHAYVWGDGGAVTQLAGKSKVLMRLDQVTPKWISQIQYVSEDGIKKQNEQIRKSMRALFLAMKYMREQTERGRRDRREEDRLEPRGRAGRPQDLGVAHVARRHDEHGGPGLDAGHAARARRDQEEAARRGAHRPRFRAGQDRLMLGAWALGALLLLLAPAVAHAQLFVASKPNPSFMIGPLFIRAAVGPELKPVVVEILWSVAVPPGRTAGDLGQDLYLLWPGGLIADPAVGQARPRAGALHHRARVQRHRIGTAARRRPEPVPHRGRAAGGAHPGRRALRDLRAGHRPARAHAGRPPGSACRGRRTWSTAPIS